MTPRLSPVAGAALVLAALAGPLSGCGGSSSGNGVAGKSAAEIVAATKAAADRAKSVHVSGSIVSGTTPITLDMVLLASNGGRGQLSENGLGFELIQTGGTVYIKGSPAFYRHIGGNAAAQLLQGRWLKAPTSSAEFASISSLTNLRQLIDTALAAKGTLVKGSTATINGQKAIGVTDSTKGGTLYVATSGQPYPVEVSKTGASGGTVTFDRWNQAVAISAPANAIDIAQLRAGH